MKALRFVGINEVNGKWLNSKLDEEIVNSK